MDNVLVLNSDYTPINITSTIRGFILLSKGKAELLKSGENPIISGDKTYVRPLIIRLLITPFDTAGFAKLKVSSLDPLDSFSIPTIIQPLTTIRTLPVAINILSTPKFCVSQNLMSSYSWSIVLALDNVIVLATGSSATPTNELIFVVA